MKSKLLKLILLKTISPIIIYSSILPDLQAVFGHLQESKLQYYTPDVFWKNFKLYGQPINVREQRDALEFFNDLIDQVDEILKVTKFNMESLMGLCVVILIPMLYIIVVMPSIVLYRKKVILKYL